MRQHRPRPIRRIDWRESERGRKRGAMGIDCHRAKSRDAPFRSRPPGTLNHFRSGELLLCPCSTFETRHNFSTDIDRQRRKKIANKRYLISESSLKWYIEKLFELAPRSKLSIRKKKMLRRCGWCWKDGWIGTQVDFNQLIGEDPRPYRGEVESMKSFKGKYTRIKIRVDTWIMSKPRGRVFFRRGSRETRTTWQVSSNRRWEKANRLAEKRGEGLDCKRASSAN